MEPNTHVWEMFITPGVMRDVLERNNLSLRSVSGTKPSCMQEERTFKLENGENHSTMLAITDSLWRRHCAKLHLRWKFMH